MPFLFVVISFQLLMQCVLLLVLWMPNRLFLEHTQIVFRSRFHSMDFDHRVKGKTGSGPISDAQRQLSQRDRLLKLAMETSDISKVGLIRAA